MQTVVLETKDTVALLDVLHEKYRYRRFFGGAEYERAKMVRTATSIGYAPTFMYRGVRILEILPSVAGLTLKFYLTPELLYGMTWAMTPATVEATLCFENDGVVVVKYAGREVITQNGLVAGLQELGLVMPEFERHNDKDAIAVSGF